MPIRVGPYRFSVMDARRTLAHAADFLDAFPPKVHPHQTDRRARIMAATAGLDAMRADADSLRGPVEIVWRELLAARADLLAADARPDSVAGRVTHLATSDGGVPKNSVEHITVDHAGVAGDRQGTRRHHGAPFQALCLWSAEVIESFATTGHPLPAGAAGENVTITGLDWADVHPGVRLAIGTVLCEVSSHAVPCKQNAQWFSDGDFTRIHHDRGPVSRMYATVLEPGAISVGDAAVLEPQSHLCSE